MIGPKPPFTLQTAQQKVKVLQALWNTRDAKKILTSFAPTVVRRVPVSFRDSQVSATPSDAVEVADYALFRGLERDVFAIGEKFGFSLEYFRRIELLDSRIQGLQVKFFEEYHDEKKHFDDPRFKNQYHDYPGGAKKLWKSNRGLKFWRFDDEGRIDEEIHVRHHKQMKERQRIFNSPAEDRDNVVIPPI